MKKLSKQQQQSVNGGPGGYGLDEDLSTLC